MLLFLNLLAKRGVVMLLCYMVFPYYGKQRILRSVFQVQSFSTLPASLVPRRILSTSQHVRLNDFKSSAYRRFLASSNPELDKSASNSDVDQTDLLWSTERVRGEFIRYFQSKEHRFIPSSACVPLNDPTLLFTNAGMNQFKSIFLGQVEPNTIYEELSAVVNSQKCIRAGGKHNDLEDVGRDTYHHTFFEMLGTWSFNNHYFKEEAIRYAFELLTEVYRLDPARLYATYFEGDDSVPADIEARDFWLQYLPEDHVIPCTAKDNFWEMGDTGPCGPCTEIHFDRIGGGRNAAHLVNQDDPYVIEIWNVVFIQYNREVNSLSTLPAQHVDTGMGLERLVSILQNKTSNYDIDCFQPLFAKIAEHSTVGAYTGRVYDDSAMAPSDLEACLKDTAYRAIADHARTLSFAIADGAVPNNEGRGYVLRRILRRATRYGQQVLGAKPGFFASLIPVVVETFGETYPELIQAQNRIIEIIQEEEQSFSSMLDRGIKYFTELKGELELQQQTIVSGEQAFFLYDTLGFPIDLTEQMAQEAKLSVDTAGFKNAMQEQKQRSRIAQRASRLNNGEQQYPLLELIAEQTVYLAEKGVFVTDDGFKYRQDVQSLPATVMAIYTSNGFLESDDSSVDDVWAVEDDFVGLVLDKTSFYSEAGGQETDIGMIELIDDRGAVTGTLTVTDVQTYGGYVLHKGVIESGLWKVGMHVNCRVDYDRRRRIAPNHSMTHVLNAALRGVLGDGVEQRGSLCNEEKLRFDFSHKKALTLPELKKVEEICQSVVSKGEIVSSEMMPLAAAKQIDGVRAVFGEVYPDPVRVIRIGDDTSVEFCGGTHIANTAEAEAFVLIEETAVAKGIRRISAVTKKVAVEAIESGKKFDSLVGELEKLDPSLTMDLDKQAGAIRKELDAAPVSACLKAELRLRIEEIQKIATEVKLKALQKRVDSIVNDLKIVVDDAIAAQASFLVTTVDVQADTKTSQRITNAVKKFAPNLAFLGISEEEPGSAGRVLAFAIVPDDVVASCGLKADEWVRASLESCSGRGGGKPNSAQAQASSCDDLTVVYENAKAFAESKITAMQHNP